MIFSLLLGIVLGGISVVFALQNSEIVTVQFMTDQITAPLAMVLLGTMLSGAVVTLLILLPSVIRDEMYLRAVRRQKREVEDEFAKYRTSQVRVEEKVTSTTVAKPVMQ